MSITSIEKYVDKALAPSSFQPNAALKKSFSLGKEIEKFFRQIFVDLGLISKHECRPARKTLPGTLSLKPEKVCQKYAAILSYEEIIALKSPELRIDAAHVKSKIMIYKWLSALTLPEETKQAFVQMLRNNDQFGFSSKLEALACERMAEIEKSGMNLGYFLWKELRKNMHAELGGNSFTACARLLSQTQQYEKKIKQLQHIAHALGEAEPHTEKAKRLEEKLKQLQASCKEMMTRDEAEPPALRYHFLAKLGELRQMCRKVSEQCGSMQTKPGGDAQEHSLKNRSIFIATCSFGGGHNSAKDAVKKYAESAGAHVSFADFSTDVLCENQAIYHLGKIFGENWSAPDIFNFILRNQLYGVMNFMVKVDVWVRELLGIGGLSSIEPAQGESDSKVKRLIRERLLKERPDQIVTVYHMDLNPTIEVAKELGIPIAHVATDFDMKMREPFENSAPNYAHFKAIAPFDKEEILATAYPLKPEQVIVAGAPVRPDFLKHFSAEEIAEWKKKKGLSPDTKIAVVMGGGGGQALPYPELLANSKNWDEKTHVIVIAGANKEFADHLKSSLSKKGEFLYGSNPKVSVEVAVDPSPADLSNPHKLSGPVVAMLEEVADVLVSKPGGLSTMEALYKGIPVVFDHRVELFSWEEDNINKVVQAARGCDGRSIDSFESDLKAAIALGKDKEHKAYKKLPTDKNLCQILAKMLQEAEADADMQKKRAAYS